MKFIGAHVDTAPDLGVAPLLAAELGANAFALNLTDPGKWKSPALSDDVVSRFRTNCASGGFTAAQILPHAGFVINAGSPDARKLKLSRLALADEFERAARLGLSMVNFHPGAHLRQMDEEACLSRVVESINTVLDTTEGVTAVIENTAGQGSNIGYSFGQLARIIEGVKDRSRVGVCIDTAHAFAAGYDLSTPDGYDAVWDEFESVVGFDYLRGMHLNDSMRPVSSRIDRHAPIGAGHIGQWCFDRIMSDPRFDDIPLILETPDPSLWAREIARLRAEAQES